MKRYRGGQCTHGGIYWSLRTGEFITIPRGGGALPGDEGSRYLRAPLGLVMVAGPIMGLAYIIFLPLLGIGGLASFLAQRLVSVIRKLGYAVSQSAGPAWWPRVAYRARAGRKTRSKEEGLIRELEAELSHRRTKK